MKTESRFEIDTLGFKTQMSEMPLWKLIQELISNGFDESSVSSITVNVKEFKDAKIHVQCIDDGNGFEDYRDIFTLYKDSYKRTNPNQRGRFNLGEKQFFAVAEFGSVYTRNLLVEFKDDERTIDTIVDGRKGTAINAIFVKPNNESVETILDKLHCLIVPSDKTLSLNGINVEQKPLVKKFKSVLPTTIASEKNSKLVLVKRETDVILYRKNGSEPSLIYELGVPIQELQDDIQWHIDVRQKVPQTTSRDVVSDKYLQALYSEIARNTLDLITVDNVGNTWVSDALKKSDPETSKAILTKMYGTDKIIVEATNDYRANEKAMEQGFVVIKGSTLDSDVRNNLKNSNLLPYASKEFGTTFGDAKSVEPNENMLWFASIVKKIALDVTGKQIEVGFYSMRESDTGAEMSGNTMSFNVGRLGKKFFNNFNEQAIGLVIHELAHFIDDESCGQYAHLKMSFINNLQKIAGAVGFRGIGYWLK